MGIGEFWSKGEEPEDLPVINGNVVQSGGIGNRTGGVNISIGPDGRVTDHGSYRDPKTGAIHNYIGPGGPQPTVGGEADGHQAETVKSESVFSRVGAQLASIFRGRREQLGENAPSDPELPPEVVIEELSDGGRVIRPAHPGGYVTEARSTFTNSDGTTVENNVTGRVYGTVEQGGDFEGDIRF